MSFLDAQEDVQSDQAQIIAQTKQDQNSNIGTNAPYIANNDITNITNQELSANIELDHTIGFNAYCSKPLHFLQIPNNIQQSNNHNNNNTNQQTIEPNEEKSNHSFDYCTISGASIILNQFNKPQNQVFLQGHTNTIVACDISQNKQLIASAQIGNSPDVFVWNISTQELIYKLEEHTHGVDKVSFSDDSRFLATVGSIQDKHFFIWDMLSGYIVSKDTINPCPINDIIWGGRVKDIKKRETTDYLFATCGKNEVRIWALSPQNGTLLSQKCITTSYQRNYTCLSFSYDNDLLFAGTTSSDFIIFSVRQLSVLANFQSCVSGVTSIIAMPMLSISPQIIEQSLNSQYFVKIIVGGGDGTVTTWIYNDDQETFLEQEKIQLNGSVMALDIKYDFTEIIAGTNEGYIYKIQNNISNQNNNNTKNNNNQYIIESINETTSIIGAKFPSNISNQFVSCSNRGSIRKWNINNYSISLSHLKCKSLNLNTTCFDLNNEIIILGWNDGYIRSYNMNESNQYLWDIKDAHKTGVSSIKLSYNQKYIASGGNDGSLRIWDLRFRKLVSHLKEHSNIINNIELYNDSRHALTCSRDRCFICWDLGQQKRVSCHRQQFGGINNIKLSNDQNIVITVGNDKAITFWDIRENKPINQIINAHKIDIHSIDISNDGNIIATGGNDCIVKLWDIRKYKNLASQSAHSQGINDVAFSFDDRQLVSVGQDANIMLWNIYRM